MRVTRRGAGFLTAVIAVGLVSVCARALLERGASAEAGDGGCGSPASWELHLEEHQRWRLNGPLPVAVAALDESRIYALDSPSGRVLQLRRDGSVVPAGHPSDTGFVLIAPGRGRLLAVRDTTIHAYDDRAAGFRPTVFVNRRWGRPAALLDGSRGMWLVQWQGREASLRLIRSSRSGSDPGSDSSPVLVWRDGAARLHPYNGDAVLTAGIPNPYELALVTADGEITWTARPAAEDDLVTPSEYERASLVSVAAVPLDCGRLLHVLADLRTELRRLIVYEGEPPSPVRHRDIQTAIGLVQSVAGSRLVLGVDATEGRADVVLFRWRWT